MAAAYRQRPPSRKSEAKAHQQKNQWCEPECADSVNTSRIAWCPVFIENLDWVADVVPEDQPALGVLDLLPRCLVETDPWMRSAVRDGNHDAFGSVGALNESAHDQTTPQPPGKQAHTKQREQQSLQPSQGSENMDATRVRQARP